VLLSSPDYLLNKEKSPTEAEDFFSLLIYTFGTGEIISLSFGSKDLSGLFLGFSSTNFSGVFCLINF
jgi:hypothetical protein